MNPSKRGIWWYTDNIGEHFSWYLVAWLGIGLAEFGWLVYFAVTPAGCGK